MCSYREDDVIDLTSSFTPVDHSGLSNVVIDLVSDDSFTVTSEVNNSQKHRPKSHKSKETEKNSSNQISACPICLDKLGTKPLAATKCGHVFCFKCLEDTLQIKRQCPTCRLALTGKSAYHPLYLS